MSNTILDRKSIINVLNYNTNTVILPIDRHKAIVFNASDGVNPVRQPITPHDLMAANGNTNAFSKGYLRFEPNEEAEIYSALHILDWEKILTREKITDIILNPTVEKMQELLDITDTAIFERVRSVFFYLKSHGYDISIKVDQLIHNRYDELRNGIRKTHLALVEKEIITPDQKVAQLEEELQKQKDDFAIQLEEMKKLLQEALAAKENSNASVAETTQNSQTSKTRKAKTTAAK